MSFNEKLQSLRKNKKLSQEGLADMLEVSRQAVSKWESGQTYPEMDKLIAICKIFGCSLDELTNDEIKEISTDYKTKSTLDSLFNDSSKLISKSIKMFKGMSFKELVKFLIIMFNVGILILILHFPIGYIYNLGVQVFENFGSSANVITSIWNFILETAYLILAIVLFASIYKLRFLDNFHEDTTKKTEAISEIKTEAMSKIKKSNKEKDELLKETIKIKSDNNNYASLFKTLGRIFSLLIRIITIFIGTPFLILFFCLFLLFIIWFGILFQGLIYIGLFFVIASAIVLNLMIIEIIFKFVIQKSASMKRIFIMLICSIIGLGIGSGITMFDIAKITYMNKAPENIKVSTKVDIIKLDDKLMMTDKYTERVEFIIDNTLGNDIKIEMTYYEDYTNAIAFTTDLNNFNLLNITAYDLETVHPLKMLNIVIENLKKNEIYNYSELYSYHAKVYATEQVIKTLTERYDKYEKEMDENERHIREEELSSELWKVQEKLYDLQEKYDNLEDQHQEEIEKYKTQIEEYKNRINEYKNAFDTLVE